MSHSVEMPELGESVTEGTITQWLKSVGDTVEADEPLLEVSTDKVDTEVPSPVSGTILEIKAEEDDTVEVGDVIAVIGDADKASDSSDSDSDSSDDASSEDSDGAGSDDSDDSDASSEKKSEKKSSGGSGKATDVEMPELGESVTEGTITQWLKSVGDTVEVDEPLLEVSTDKVDTEVPSPVAGTIVEILADEDDTVEVGDVIVRIGDEDAAAGGADDSDDSDDADNAADDKAASEDASSKDNEDKKESSEKKSEKKSSGGSGKATDVEMPELGESVTEGTITQWLKSVGDTVEVDEPLLEVSTDKVDTEVPSPVAGTIVEILADEDDTVEVGDVIVRIGDEDAAAGGADDSDDSDDSDDAADDKTASKDAASENKDSKSEEKQESKSASKSESKSESKPAEKSSKDSKDSGKKNSGKVPYVTPLVRKLADKHGVDLNSLEGTGVGGRIRKQDVMAAVEGESAGSSAAGSEQGGKDSKKSGSNWSTKSVDPEKAELRGTTQKVNRIRQITASKMVEALQISAQLTHVQEIDMTAIANLRKANKQAFVDKHGSKLTFLPFFVKATVEALVSHPNVNASYNAETQEMTYHADVNVAIAVDTPKGLLTPVIKKAQDKTLPEIAAEIVDLADRARNNKLKPNDLTGATFTVTNIGSEGALLDTPILVPPQAGILGTAVIEKRPVVVTEDGQDAIAIRQMCYLPFTYDHQVVDGADAGRFITTIKDRLETADFESDLDL